MDLRLLSKDHAGTVAVCDDTLTEIQYTTVKNTTAGQRRAASGPSKLVCGSAGSVKPARQTRTLGLHISAPSAIVGSLCFDELLEVRQVFLDGVIIHAKSGSGFLHQPGGLPVQLHRHTCFVLG